MRFLSRDISNDVAAFFVTANRAFNHGNACSWALIGVVVAVLERIRRFPFAVDVIRVIQSSAQDDDTRFLFSASDRRVTSHLLVKYREMLS